jgi:hypothetical protein
MTCFQVLTVIVNIRLAHKLELFRNLRCGYWVFSTTYVVPQAHTVLMTGGDGISWASGTSVCLC